MDGATLVFILLSIESGEEHSHPLHCQFQLLKTWLVDEDGVCEESKISVKLPDTVGEELETSKRANVNIS